MTFTPISKQLQQAVISNDVTKTEELILNSDTRKDLIVEHILQNGKDSLISLLPHFRSKGLVLNIKTLLNI